MRIKTFKRIFVLIAASIVAFPAMAQNPISGRIVDGENGSALAGVVITNTRTGDVAVSNNDGSFRIKSTAGEQILEISYLGYKKKDVTVTAGQTSLGDVALEIDAISVANVVIVAGIVTSDRQTPVAVSNITREQLEMRLSNRELPEILKSTPSIYATKSGPSSSTDGAGAGGGYGDARINIRGFENHNVGVLVNGVPVNDMENGKVYWANWGGLSDVMSFMQVQRGLGASKLGLSSVGGTINIVTKSTDAERGGSFYYGVGNDGLRKMSFSVSSGLGENGWAFTIAGGRQSADNNYLKGTGYEAWNYFANLSKVIGDGRHRLSLTAFGAPQWHNQSYNRYMIEDYATHPDGRRMNLGYGYMNGKVLNPNYNFYHKPQISLVHNWEIDSKSMLSTSVYASIARGGGRALVTAPGVTNDLFLQNNGRPYETAKRTADGLIDWNAVYAENSKSANGSNIIFANSNNAHDWYGILSTYTNQITDAVRFTGGIDGRYYKGYHQRDIADLLGGKFVINNTLETRPVNAQSHVGDLIYDEIGWVARGGIFAQAEYVKNNVSAFISGSITGHFLRFANYGNTPAAGYGTLSEWVGFMPWSVKAGASYKLGRNHSVFANAGYFTIAPQMNNAFPGFGTVPNSDATMEKVTTAEAGYTFANNVFNVTFNGYYTLWLDRSRAPISENTGEGTVYYNVLGVDARHMGLELEATYRPTTRLTLKAMGSVGDWIWRKDVNFTAYNEQQEEVGSFISYIGGIHVSDAAQITAAVSATWEPFKGLRVGADYNWYGKNFARSMPGDRAHISNKGVESWRMPDYGVVDAQLSYRFQFSDKLSATFYGNVNNLLDTWYISDAIDNRAGNGHDAKSAVVWYGFGRTWTAGLKFNF